MEQKMKRRTALAALGAISLGVTLPDIGKAASFPVASTCKRQQLKTDILVVGGGTAGVIAAIQAGRAGMNTVLLENGSQLGGTITTGGVAFPGIFFAWGKQIIGGIGWELVQETVHLNGDSLPNFAVPHKKQHWKHQIRINGPLYALLAEEKCVEAGVDIHYYETPTSISRKGDQWVINAVGKGVNTEIVCNQLIDCTGNAYVAGLVGYPLVREKETQPGTLMFKLEGYDIEALDLETLEKKYEEAVKRGDLVKSEFGNIIRLLKSGGDNVQHIAGADSTTALSHTLTNIKGRSSLLHTLRFLRTLPGCEGIRISEVQPEVAVRETYRIDGVYTITHRDYISGKVFDDALSYSYYPIDLHTENGVIPEQLSQDVVATIPIRALVPRGSQNFLVAGRCISSDRKANSALRVQASCMGMGQAAGAAAAVACAQKKSPLDVPLSDIRNLLTEHGGIVPLRA